MKRKIFSVLFALVLVVSFSMVTATNQTVEASPNGVVLTTSDDGIAEWSTDTAKSGSYSVLLKSGTVEDKSVGRVAVPYNGTLDSIDSISFWMNIKSAPLTTYPAYVWADGIVSEGYIGAYIILELDTDGDSVKDDWLVQYMYGEKSIGTWVERSLADGSNYGWGEDESYGTADDKANQTYWHSVFSASLKDWPDEFEPQGVGTLDQWQGTDLGTATVLKVKIAVGEWGGHPNVEEYIDDITINGEPYPLELPAARPLTVDDDRVQNPDAYFQTIQGAVDCAIAGDTIKVAAGEYYEQVFINKANLTVESFTGKAVTFIDGTGVTNTGPVGHTALVWLQKDGITFRGFTVQNYQVGWGNGGVISITGWDGDYPEGNWIDDISGCLVTENKVTSSPTDISSIVMGAGADSNIISVNEIVSSGGDGIIVNSDPDCVGNQIIGNTITDSTNYGVSLCTSTWETQRNFPGTIISGNTISGGTNGIGILYATGSAASHIVIQNNTISGVTTGDGEGIEVYYGGLVDIFRNTVQGNLKGIQVKHAGNIVVNFNDISGNTIFGLEAVSVLEDVNAERNWWGGVAGPQHWPEGPSSNPYNVHAEMQNNDEVSDNVDYMPWLIRIELVEDWNIVSWPIWGEEWEEEYEPPEWMGPVYYFDSLTQYWGQPGDGGEETALNAMYIKVDLTGLEITAPVTISYCISSDASFPSQKEMKRGWNLVGLAELHPMLVDDALVDAYYGTGEANLVGYSRVISPPVHQPNWSFLRDSEAAVDEVLMAECMGLCMDDGQLPQELLDCLDECSWRTDCLERCMEICTALGPGDLDWCLEECMDECCCRECCMEICTIPLPAMFPTKGYWVYMVNDGWLGGFTSTPIVEVP